MDFSSYEFIFLFLPLVIIIYFLLSKFKNKNAQLVFLILSSLIFYSYNNVAYLGIIIASILGNYFIGKMLNKQYQKRKSYLIIGILFNVILLGYFKYTNFFIANINEICGTEFNLINIILPLGISFFTFQQIAHLIGIYKRQEEADSLLEYFLFVTFFPYVISGPISIYGEIIPQFKIEENRKANYSNISKGLYLFLIGLFKKIVIANTISLWVDNGYSSLDNIGLLPTWITILTYTFQIYFDFSGYSDMAIGIGKMFNIKLPYNFNSPYKATSVRDFWNRWHISLSKFLTKNIYIPLGGSRKGKFKTYINTLITFLVSGIWHGASWTYIIWGILHGIACIFERVFDGIISKIPNIIKRIITFIFISLTWVFFRANNLTQVGQVFKGMVNFNNLGLNQLGELAYDGIFSFPNMLNVAYIVIVLFILLLIIFKCKNSNEKYEEMKLTKYNLVVMIILFIISVVHLNKVGTFIYFNF